jgi:uncharacterized zinc-type alcohol dehydrogenase-like protein
MLPARSYAAFDAASPLGPYPIERREPGPSDVVITIHYCGICHTDLHFVKDDLGMTRYPIVPGHEIAGVVESVGSAVTRFRAGDKVGVGCMVNSCRTCASCADGEEQYCAGTIMTYGWTDRDGTVTYGGYSTRIVVDQDFVLRIPDSLPLDAAAPLLCAGITTYSPLRTWKAGPGSKVAVVGMGGLGHMAVKLAVAMGAEVTVISTSDRKRDDAMRMGAKAFLVSKNEDAMKGAAGTFDHILNTVSSPHEVNDHIALLAKDGTMVMLGVVAEPLPVSSLPLIFGRRRIAGSLIGGIAETQEMLDFCAEHGVVSDIEIIPASRINEAYERLMRSDVRYRFVIDVKTMEG